MAGSITWHSFDLKTGRRGQQLTTKQMGAVGRTIGEATEAQQSVKVYDVERETATDGIPTTAGEVAGWDAATLPGRVMLVAVDDQDQPVWAGMVLRRQSTFEPWVDLSLATLEAYLDRRYVRDHTYTQVPQGVLIEGVLTADATPTGVRLLVDAQSTTLRDRTYLDSDDKTVLSVLQDLMAVDGGPDFTVDLEWGNPEHTILNPILRARDRLGTASTRPVTRFEQPGCVQSGEYVEDFTSDNGANDVMATSSGEGDIRPRSAHQVAQPLLDNGWVKFERRFEPSTSITDPTTLDAYARADLLEQQDGLVQLTLVTRLGEGPMIGRDFHLGDDVSAVLTNPRFPARLGPDGDVVPGYEKTVRCIGYSVDYDGATFAPVMWEL